MTVGSQVSWKDVPSLFSLSPPFKPVGPLHVGARMSGTAATPKIKINTVCLVPCRMGDSFVTGILHAFYLLRLRWPGNVEPFRNVGLR